MSNWTHVAGIVRVDDFRFDDNVQDFTEIFGKEATWGSIPWDDIKENPNNYLPMGSEGSLKMSVWVNPDKSCTASYTVSIFGDLRDHDNPQEIVDWFKNKIKDLFVRQATITVSNGWNGTVNWTYSKVGNSINYYKNHIGYRTCYY